MKVRLLITNEGDSWDATSPDVEGWYACSDSEDGLRELIEEAATIDWVFPPGAQIEFVEPVAA